MNKKAICTFMTAVTILVSLIGPSVVAAEPGKTTSGIGPIQRSIQTQKWTVDPHRSAVREQRPPMRLASPPHPTSRKMIFGVIGFVAGTVVGGVIGHGLYDRDSPDGMGAALGVCVGAVAGPILGVWAASR